MIRSILICSCLLFCKVFAQYTLLAPQTDTFNSSFSLSSDQQEQTGINATLASNFALALNFERSNFANGSTESESFYNAPSNSSQAPPGSLLKVELDANTSSYTLPPNTAISRFIFQSQSLNGSKVPVSAYILWPYQPRSTADGYSIVAWSHGSSGSIGNCAPSHYRNLLYQFAAPFELALQGYVVVAPDYLGLGVTQDANGNPLIHPYLGSPAHANDLFYSVQAAQSAFPALSKKFVIMGHSQGGGAAWAATQRQAEKPVPGYLGAVVGSPVTDIFSLVDPNDVGSDARFAAFLTHTLTDFYPGFSPNEILTSAGQKRLALLAEVGGCYNAALELFADTTGLVTANWTRNSSYALQYRDLVRNGGKRIAGPVLVLQGEADAAVPVSATTKAVDETCGSYPDSELEYATFAGVDHVPVMFASQRIFLDWIDARFQGSEVKSGCQRTNYSSARPYSYYQKEQNWFVEFAVDAYETA
ncbi:hypothetical protein ACLMJK_006149 [Lecanora helva]